MPISYFTLQSPENLTNGSGVIGYINQMSAINGEPIFGFIMLIMIFLIPLMAMLSAKRQTDESVTASLWLTMISGIFMLFIPDLINPNIVAGIVVFTALSTILLYRKD